LGLSIDPLTMAAIVGKAAKTAGATTVLLGGAVVAQTSLPELAGNLGLVALLALLVGRYTFRQLEAYREDLKDAHARGTHLRKLLEEERVESRRLNLRIHELEDHAHRLNVFITSAGLGGAPELPQTPPVSP
jgi:hypothetical protein